MSFRGRQTLVRSHNTDGLLLSLAKLTRNAESISVCLTVYSIMNAFRQICCIASFRTFAGGNFVERIAQQRSLARDSSLPWISCASSFSMLCISSSLLCEGVFRAAKCNKQRCELRFIILTCNTDSIPCPGKLGVILSAACQTIDVFGINVRDHDFKKELKSVKRI